MKWDRSCHRWPCPETDRIDAVLNEIESCTIRFSPVERSAVVRWARNRRQSSAGFNDGKVSKNSALFIECVGILGEWAVARYLGVRYQPAIYTFRRPDLPGNIEVRATSWLNGHAKVRPDDDDGRRVVLAIVPSLEEDVYLAGWIAARDGKLFALRDPHAAGQFFHFVPQSALRPMGELKISEKSSCAAGCPCGK